MRFWDIIHTKNAKGSASTVRLLCNHICHTKGRNSIICYYLKLSLMYFTSIIFYRSSTKFPGQSNAQRLFQAATNWWKIPTDWSQKCGLQSKPQRFDRKYWTGNSKFQIFQWNSHFRCKDISNKNVNFCNNNRWGLYYYAGLWPAFSCFSLVQIFCIPTAVSLSPHFPVT